MVVTPTSLKVEKSVRLKFKVSSNEVKFEAVIYALRVIKDLGATRLQLFIVSKLIAS